MEIKGHKSESYHRDPLVRTRGPTGAERIKKIKHKELEAFCIEDRKNNAV